MVLVKQDNITDVCFDLCFYSLQECKDTLATCQVCNFLIYFLSIGDTDTSCQFYLYSLRKFYHVID